MKFPRPYCQARQLFLTYTIVRSSNSVFFSKQISTWLNITKISFYNCTSKSDNFFQVIHTPCTCERCTQTRTNHFFRRAPSRFTAQTFYRKAYMRENTTSPANRYDLWYMSAIISNQTEDVVPRDRDTRDRGCDGQNYQITCVLNNRTPQLTCWYISRADWEWKDILNNRDLRLLLVRQWSFLFSFIVYIRGFWTFSKRAASMWVMGYLLLFQRQLRLLFSPATRAHKLRMNKSKRWK